MKCALCGKTHDSTARRVAETDFQTCPTVAAGQIIRFELYGNKVGFVNPTIDWAILEPEAEASF